MLSADDEALLHDLLDGRLSPAEAGRLRTRLEREPALQAALDQLERLRALARDDEGLEPPAVLRQRVRDAVAAEPAVHGSGNGGSDGGSAPRLPRAWRRVVVASYALAAMLVVAVGAIAWQHGREQEPAALEEALAPRHAAPRAAGLDGAAPRSRVADAQDLPSEAALRLEPAERLDERASTAGGEEQARSPRREVGPPVAGATASPAQAPAAPPAAPAPAAPAPEQPGPDDHGWSVPPDDVRKSKAEGLEADLDRRREAERALGEPAAPASPADAEPTPALERTRLADGGREPSAREQAPGEERPREPQAPATGAAGPFKGPGGAVPPGLRAPQPLDGAPRPPGVAPVPPPAAAASEGQRDALAEAARALEHVFVIEAASADEARALLERVLAGPGAARAPETPAAQGFTPVRLRRADVRADAALLVSLGVLPPPAGPAPRVSGPGGGGGGAAAPSLRAGARAEPLPRVLADLQRAVSAEQHARLVAVAGPAPAGGLPAEARADLRLLRILVVAPRR